ncbi:MAG: EcsC family protein [Thermohalobaculum sp.]
MNETATRDPAILPPQARQELDGALLALRTANPIVRAADMLGRAVGHAGDALIRRAGLPPSHPFLTAAAEQALSYAFDVAVLGAKIDAPPQAGGILAAASGLAGGAAGLAGFLPDAAFTTLIIMRDIARAAQSAGEDLTSDATRAACIQVFFLKTGEESGYLSARLLVQSGAVRALIARAASTWGALLGEKLAAGTVPVLSALSAASLNVAFVTHYRGLARGHFTIRRLEREHGEEAVRVAAGWPEKRDQAFFD